MSDSRDRLRQIAALARSVSSALDLEDVLERVTLGVVDIRPGVVCAVRLVDEAAGGYRLAAVAGLAHLRPAVLPFGKGLTHEVAASRCPLLVLEAAGDERLAGGEWPVAGFSAYYGVPIEAADRLLGVLSVVFPTGEPPTEPERETLDILAGHTAVAIRNALLYADSEARRKAAEALGDIAHLLAQSLNPSVVGMRIADSVRTLLGVRSATLLKVDAGSGDLVVLTTAGEPVPGYEPGRVLPAGSGLASIAIAARAPQATPDVLADPRVTFSPALRATLEGAPDRALLAVPLVVRGRVIGALSARDRTGRLFRPGDIRLAQAFASHAAIALENARLHEETQRRLRETETLLGVGRALDESLDLPEVARRACREMARALGADAGGAWRVGESGFEVLPVAGYRVPEGMAEVFRRNPPLFERPLVERIGTLRGLLYWPDSQADPLFDDPLARLVAHRAVLAVPVLSRGAVIGAFVLVWLRSARPLSPDELRLAEAVGRQAGVAFEKALLAEELGRARQRLAEARRLPRPVPPGGETILVVDDEQEIVDLAREMLERHGYRVLTARGGSEALRLAAGHRGAIDALVTDVVMPGMNGSELAERLARERPAIRVLFVSGFTGGALEGGAAARDDRAFVAKPFSTQALVQGLRALLDRPRRG